MVIHWKPAPILLKEAEDAHNGDSVNILNGAVVLRPLYYFRPEPILKP